MPHVDDRLEATAIPTLLVAPRTADDGQEVIDEDDDDNVGGYYNDGAYTAAPSSSMGLDENKYPWERDEEAAAKRAAQAQEPIEACYAGIQRRFLTLRTQLSETPPRYVLERLGRDQGCHMGGSARDWQSWRWRIKNSNPEAAQLAGMGKSTVLKVLRVVMREFGVDVTLGKEKKKKNLVSSRMSRWTWGLLARLPERGELSSEEVGIVRDLGKRAVWVGVRVKGVHDVEKFDAADEEGEEDDAEVLDTVVDLGDDIVAATEDVDDIGDDDAAAPIDTEDAALEEDLEVAKARMLAQLVEPSLPQVEVNVEEEIPPLEEAPISEVELEADADPETEESLIANTRVTVDTVLTIVGELYGQRDLLEFREGWARVVS